MEICYHYKYQVEYVENLDNPTFNMLWHGIQRIKSQNLLEGFTAADFPHMKKDDRRKVHKNTYKVAYPESIKKRTVSTDDLLKMGFKGMKTNG